jgi:hypothetical protein
VGAKLCPAGSFSPDAFDLGRILSGKLQVDPACRAIQGIRIIRGATSRTGFYFHCFGSPSRQEPGCREMKRILFMAA